jgi:hypothetical protein
MAIKDLRHTRLHSRLKLAHERREAVPELTTQLSVEVDDHLPSPNWAEAWEDTEVPVERVIAYYSWVLAPAETRYSATEREALAAKESLVKFQPFIEGKQILLVTDHAVLTWAKTYENANRRLASWGLVFAAYPQLKIVYQPGRVHSNVNPLSRLPLLPAYATPARDDLPDPSLDNEYGSMELTWSKFIRSRESQLSAMATTRAVRVPASEQAEAVIEGTLTQEAKLRSHSRKGVEKGIRVTPGTLLIQVSDETVQEFLDSYPGDTTFGTVYARSKEESPHDLKQRAYRLSEKGLLFFEDADSKLCLCVPAPLRD